MKKFDEKYLRTIVKVISWRILITFSHVINAFIVTGSLLTGFKIAGLSLVVNSIIFWMHERCWNFLQWNRTYNEKLRFFEGHSRSISKVVSWRIVITISNIIVPFLITGSWGQAALYAGVATLVNTFLYWSHERIWNFFKFGKKIKVYNNEKSR